MEFLNCYTILYDDIPNYKEFCEPFQIPINCKLLKYIDEVHCSNRPELHQQIKELLNQYFDREKTNINKRRECDTGRVDL